MFIRDILILLCVFMSSEKDVMLSEVVQSIIWYCDIWRSQCGSQSFLLENGMCGPDYLYLLCKVTQRKKYDVIAPAKNIKITFILYYSAGSDSKGELWCRLINRQNHLNYLRLVCILYSAESDTKRELWCHLTHQKHRILVFCYLPVFAWLHTWLKCLLDNIYGSSQYMWKLKVGMIIGQILEGSRSQIQPFGIYNNGTDLTWHT
jgi:hypothetical protein